jgi:DNA polymerase III delta prime subunit
LGAKKFKTYAQAEEAEEAEEARALWPGSARAQRGVASASRGEASGALAAAPTVATCRAGSPGGPVAHSLVAATSASCSLPGLPRWAPLPRANETESPRRLFERPLPWELFSPRSSDEIKGQDAARAQVRQWLKRPREKRQFLLSALVLQGPPGCGKTALARCCIEEAALATVEYGPHEEQDLPSFLRLLGAVDCAGRGTCLLLDDATQVLDAQRNAGAAKTFVTFPIICTADFVVRRARAQYGAVVSMWPLRACHMRELLDVIGPRLSLQRSSYAGLVAAARGDARQLCVHSAFTSCSALQAHRDAILSPYERARALLDHGQGAALYSDELTHQEFCLLHENFPLVYGVSVEDAAGFACEVAAVDRFEADLSAACAQSLAARACCVWRRGRRFKAARLADFTGWSALKRAEGCRSLLLRIKYDERRAICPWSLSALARHHFSLESGKD